MQNNVEPDFQSQLDAVFAQLNPGVVEEFYAAYQAWSLQQRVSELRERIETVRTQQAENEQHLRETQPSAIALAALARLQSNGVNDIALLDAMLERGESWLDQTMQRLDYFEQFDDFISDDYTRWCQGALEGAFDWIDSLREDTEQAASAQSETPSEEAPSNSEDAGEVEALLLQRLATEQVDDDRAWQEAITLKRPAIQSPSPGIVSGESEEQELPAPEDGARQDAETQTQAAEYIPQNEPAQSDEAAIASNAASPAGAEEQIVPEAASPVEESALSASEPHQPALIEFAPLEEITPGEDELPTADDQPALIESAPVDEPPASSELDAEDEQPTFVEFAAPSPSEVSSPEETLGQETEHVEPTEVPEPQNVATGEDTAQGEESEPLEMEQSAADATAPNAPEEAVPSALYEERGTTSNWSSRPVRRNPRKAGLMRRLVRLIVGI